MFKKESFFMEIFFRKKKEINLNNDGIIRIHANEPDCKSDNRIRNTKYTMWSFFPMILLQQFQSFSSVFFFIIMMLQLIPDFAIGSIIPSLLPWTFVLVISLVNEGLDDYRRYQRDIECNSRRVKVWENGCYREKMCAEIKTGNVVLIMKGERVPADCIILKTEDPKGELFIRTDQLDGETDWKGRLAVNETQMCKPEIIEGIEAHVEMPHKDIYSFNGRISLKFHKSNSVIKELQPDSESKSIVNDIFFNLTKYESKYNKGIETINNILNKGSKFRSGTNKNIVDNSTNIKKCDSIDNNDMFVSVGLENTIWANTVAATCSAIGLVIYTGKDTRSMMNTYKPRSKFGKLEKEIDRFVAMLGFLSTVAALWFTLTKASSLEYSFVILLVRFVMIFSYVIPISLKVSINLARIYYVSMLQGKLPGAIVRTSSLQEELGRISFFLSDKTGTLTKNEMTMKRVHLGTICYTHENTEEIRAIFEKYVLDSKNNLSKHSNLYKDDSYKGMSSNLSKMSYKETSYNDSDLKRDVLFKKTRSLERKIYDMIEALAVCHNVTPVVVDGEITYHASSPDEVAILRYTASVGMQLVRRERNQIVLKTPAGFVTYRILEIFPFNSDTKRMGIIVLKEKQYDYDSEKIKSIIDNGEMTCNSKDNNNNNINSNGNNNINGNSNNNINGNINSNGNINESKPTDDTKNSYLSEGFNDTGEILFFMKGADSTMKNIVIETDWAEEETDNMARNGFRTLLVGKRLLTQNEYADFRKKYDEAKLLLANRAEKVFAEQCALEKGLELLGITGVEDMLQDRVSHTLEGLRNAGLKIWMLTGDKIETAISIALSSKLLDKMDRFLVVTNCNTKQELAKHISTLNSKRYNAIVIDGTSLGGIIKDFLPEFIAAAKNLTCLIGCRYTPTQKAVMTAALKKYAGETVCAIGDGGNDVSMITEADVGIGIEGKEGNQASLAADFSVKTFSMVSDLLFWHGRRCYKNSSGIAGLIIHRGTVIAIIQGIFCALIHFFPISIFQGRMLPLFMCYTFLPLFAFIRAEDISRKLVLKFPELYKELRKSNLLSFKKLFVLCLNSFFQASIIMLIFFWFHTELFFLSILVFTTMIFNEQLMIIFTIERLNLEVFLFCALSLFLYFLSTFIFDELSASESVFKNFPLILFASSVAMIFKIIRRIYKWGVKPASYTKLGFNKNRYLRKTEI